VLSDINISVFFVQRYMMVMHLCEDMYCSQQMFFSIVKLVLLGIYCTINITYGEYGLEAMNESFIIKCSLDKCHSIFFECSPHLYAGSTTVFYLTLISILWLDGWYGLFFLKCARNENLKWTRFIGYPKRAYIWQVSINCCL
jgi:hypothetical protein